MSLRFIYGRSGTGKTSFCFKEISKQILKSNKIYIITPEQFSFTAEQNLMNSVKSKAVINAEVLTFERMAYRVLNEVGGILKTNLSKSGRAMLLFDIMDEHKNELKYLGKTQKNLETISRLITELKKHNINSNIIKGTKQELQDKRLEYKLEDINIILENFENAINNNFIDENDLLTMLYQSIDAVNMFNDTVIYIDEFAGFTKQEYLIIEKLLNISKEVNISICTDNLQSNTNPDTDIFYPNKKACNKIIEIAKEKNIEIKPAIVLDKTYRFKTEELNILEKHLAGYSNEKYIQDVENINLYLAKNSYNEVEYVAKNVIDLVRNKEYKYKEIAVITKDIPKYSGLIKAIFGKYNIPVFIDEKQDLSQNILVKYITAFLDIFAKNWSIESMFNYIKSGFLDLELEDIFILENYCKNLGIKGIKKYTEEWKIELGGYDLNKLNELRIKIIEPLVEFRKSLNNNKIVYDITKNMYNFLIKNEVDKKISHKALRLQEIGQVDLANIYSSSWNILMEVLDELVLVLGEKKVSFEKYSELLKVGLNESSLGKIPATLDEVTVGDVDRSRSSKKKIVFIIGLNDGVFPSNNTNEGFIDDNERNNLKKLGVELAKTLVEQMYDENFNIYKAFTISEEKLYLSYSSSDSEGKGLRKSILINKIKRIFANLKEENETTYISESILTKDTTFDMLLTNLRKYFEGNKIDNIWFEIYNIYKEDIVYKDKLKEAISGFYYSNMPEKLDEENLKKLYGDTLKTSISKLETYRRCAFSYYIKYGLRLSEKTEFKLESLDTGTFMHEVIDEFFESINEQRLSLKKLEDKEIEEILDKIINDKLKLNKNYIFNSTPKYIVLTNRLKRVIKKSIKYIIDTIRNSDFRIYGNEIEFGEGKQYSPIEIELENNKKVQIIGKIDRVDIAENEDGKYIRIIDYKSSIKNIDLNEMMAGIQIQLLTYLDALTEKQEANPAGVLYFNLIEPLIKVKNRNITDEELENEIRNNFRMNGLILGDVKVVQMMDKSLTTGKSNIVPAYIDQKGEVSKAKSSTVDSVEFKILQKQINKILKQISEEILTGKIEPNPVYISKNKTTPCLYCNFKAICGFNPDFKDNNYKYVPKLGKNEVLSKLKEKL